MVASYNRMECYGFLFPFAIMLPIICFANTSLNITTDRSALLSLKTHLVYQSDDHILQGNWSSKTSSVCDWIGVTCGHRHQRVIALNISRMGLSGPLPPQIGNLSFLSSLDISRNRFRGSPPQELGFLRRLTYINLVYNNFSGDFPSWMIHLPKLRIMGLAYNGFTGVIPSFICNMSELQVVHLGGNFLRGRIPEDMNRLRNLNYFDLQYNQLTGPLPLGLFNISSLQVISLIANRISGNVPPDMCHHLPNLQGLFLSHNRLSGTIPRMIFQCSQLQILSLTSNNLTGKIPDEICKLKRIKEVVLEENNLEGVIPQGIFNISSLRYLTLRSNQLVGRLPSFVGQNLNLEQLSVAINFLSGSIPDSIANASKLSVLTLLMNNFSGSIPITLGKLEFLEKLVLEKNNFISKPSPPEASFLTSLTSCRNLEILSFAGNPNLNHILPASIGNLSASLQVPNGERCKITGSIPDEIGNLSNLGLLSLRFNNLTGNIPTSIKKLRGLQRLYLGDNNLGGSIPNDICSLQNLGLLDIGRNQITGSIPPCLENATSLRYIVMSSNKLKSNIPSSLGNLRDLLLMDLSSNLLTGSIPQEIGNLKVAILIDLSFNKFTGYIPNTVGDMQHLINIRLNNNRLQGAIPISFGNIFGLEHLDLSQNNLSGPIPKSLEALLYLKFFNVSFNKLEGEIPIKGPFVNFTSESFISNEGLCGSPRFHVHLCPSDANLHSSRKRIPLVVYVFVPSVSLGMIVILTYMCIRYRKEQPNPLHVDWFPVVLHKRFSYYELRQATNEFSESNFLGEGSCGLVYKGFTENGKQLAIKVFNIQVESALRSFDTECELLRNLRHRNLTKVIGSCSNLDFKALVLQYMTNGSLEKWLYSHNYFLDILQRINIMIDVASALEYLHQGYSISVIHCDMKPSNILLDEHFVGHISDFGIAKLLGERETIRQTITLATIGYMAPEYGQDGIISTMIDVYSFGIILMETFTRTKPTDNMFEGEFTLKRWVEDSLYDSKISVVDANLLKSDDNYAVEKRQCIHAILEMALSCCVESPEKRINIRVALAMLKKIKIQFCEIGLTR